MHGTHLYQVKRTVQLERFGPSHPDLRKTSEFVRAEAAEEWFYLGHSTSLAQQSKSRIICDKSLTYKEAVDCPGTPNSGSLSGEHIFMQPVALAIEHQHARHCHTQFRFQTDVPLKKVPRCCLKLHPCKVKDGMGVDPKPSFASDQLGFCSWTHQITIYLVKLKLLSRVQLFATPWTIRVMEFSRPEYQSGQLFPPPGNLPNPGIEPVLQVNSLPAEPPGKSIYLGGSRNSTLKISFQVSSATCLSLIIGLVFVNH